MILTVGLSVAVMVLARIALPAQHVLVGVLRTLASAAVVLVAYATAGQVGLLIVSGALVALALSRTRKHGSTIA
ncbi:MAG: hypothetical protein L0H59_11010 [Tomitella sp.]|nr:hypothetical protein [Tomitella sp.]